MELTTPTNTPAGVIVQTPTTNTAPIAPQQNIPQTNYGGGNSFGGFIGNINWVEIGLSILAATTLMVIIYHYRQKSKLAIKEGKEMSEQVDTLKKDISEIKETLTTDNNGGLVF